MSSLYHIFDIHKSNNIQLHLMLFVFQKALIPSFILVILQNNLYETIIRTNKLKRYQNLVLKISDIIITNNKQIWYGA